ncbi:MAG: T9SS type A sorting domain-containing protein [Bacteroidota bacterium]
MKTTLPLNFLIVLALLIGATPVQLNACGCGEFPTFCERAVDHEKLLVRVIDHQIATYAGGFEEFFTQVEVLMDLDQGGYADTISLVNQNGVNCNADIFNWPTGDSLIISLPFAEIASWPEELSNVPAYSSYDLVGCGTYFLAVENGRLGGGAAEQVDLAAFISDPFNNCPILNATEEADPFSAIQLTPNPVQEELRVLNLTSTEIQFELYTIDGRPVHSIDLRAKQVGTFPMSDLPAGVYIVRQIADRQEQSQLIIKH